MGAGAWGRSLVVGLYPMVCAVVGGGGDIFGNISAADQTHRDRTNTIAGSAATSTRARGRQSKRYAGEQCGDNKCAERERENRWNTGGRGDGDGARERGRGNGGKINKKHMDCCSSSLATPSAPPPPPPFTHTSRSTHTVPPTGVSKTGLYLKLNYVFG